VEIKRKLDISNRHNTGETKKSKAELSQIISVAAGSRAEKAGVKIGDRLLAINNKPIRDMIDYQFEASDPNSVLSVEREQDNQKQILQIKLKNATGEPLGLEFAEPTFDGIKVCNNDCPFCFVYRTPKGFRPTLYVKDDDYRYSFMYGGFVTLTNLKEEDWQRIIEQRLTPLYVSVHSTDIELRRRLLGNATAPAIIEQLKRLNSAGITAHTQVVLVPTVNDKANLDKTIADLAKLYPGVQTAAIVPVGLAGGAGYEGDRRKSHRAHGRGFEQETPMPMRPFTPEESEIVIAQVQNWQKKLKRELGTPFVYLSDEFYLLCGQEVPHKAHYEDFDQIENGVGLVRYFLDDWKRTEKRLPVALAQPLTATLVTAVLITPTFRPIVTRLNEVEGFNLDLLTVHNKTLGSTVTVAGLLTGRDVIDALLQYEAEGNKLGDIIFLPQVMLDKKGYGGRFLDNLTPADVVQATGRKVVMAGLMSEVWQTISQELDNSPKDSP
jgi:putative radical SAM enzyme (TIGR03279 family)